MSQAGSIDAASRLNGGYRGRSNKSPSVQTDLIYPGIFVSDGKSDEAQYELIGIGVSARVGMAIDVPHEQNVPYLFQGKNTIMADLKQVFSVAALLLLAACSTFPTGPSVMALPGTGKSFDQFQADDANCQRFALNRIGGKTPGAVADDNGVRNAAVGTALGAAAGGLIGGDQGAAVGAGTGLLIGGLSGADSAERSAYASQRHYDSAYVQCMYGKGHRVPVSGRMSPESKRYASPLPPPPPPGYRPDGAPPPEADRLFVYPKNGQSEAKTAADQGECERWARSQMPGRGFIQRDLQRAQSACLEARGYSVR